MTTEEQQSWAVSQLQKKHTETGRIPLKSDFDVITLSRIKAFLGPWPRALEKAGLKEAKPKPPKKKKRSSSVKSHASKIGTAEKSRSEETKKTTDQKTEEDI